MKKILAITTLIIFFLTTGGVIFAHPGRTDKKGGHSCRTNCKKWGYRQGQYHFHSKKKGAKYHSKTKARSYSKQHGRYRSK